MTERFTIEDFIIALPKQKRKSDGVLVPMFDYLGMADGEHCWAHPLNSGRIRILIRSSIGSDGLAKETGADSIRIIVQRKREESWEAVSKGPDAYTQRTTGWQTRLREKIKNVYMIWRPIPQNFDDSDNVRVSKKPGSLNRVFAVGNTGFRWLS